MGLKEDHEKMLKELGVPPEEMENYFIPIDSAVQGSDLDEDLPLGADKEAFDAGYQSGYEDGYEAALQEHGLAPKKPPE